MEAPTTTKSTCPKLHWQPQHPPTRQVTSTRLQIPRPSTRLLTLHNPRARRPTWRTCPPPPTKTCLPHRTLLTRQDICILIPLSFSSRLPKELWNSLVFYYTPPPADILILQPSQYLNNNLGGHRGDIDEVSQHCSNINVEFVNIVQTLFNIVQI